MILDETVLKYDEEFGRFSQMRGILRLMRIMIVFRKMSESGEKFSKIQASRVQIEAPVDRVLRTLHSLKDLLSLPPHIRIELKYAIKEISAGRLFEVHITGEDGAE